MLKLTSCIILYSEPANLNSFLYLSDNEETVLYEVRASYLDELSIGEFHLKQECKTVSIVDFTKDIMLFQSENVAKIIKARLLRDRISKELSKPMRRYDTDIEYIPTQFICEFIKILLAQAESNFVVRSIQQEIIL